MDGLMYGSVFTDIHRTLKIKPKTSLTVNIEEIKNDRG